MRQVGAQQPLPHPPPHAQIKSILPSTSSSVERDSTIVQAQGQGGGNQYNREDHDDVTAQSYQRQAVLNQNAASVAAEDYHQLLADWHSGP